MGAGLPQFDGLLVEFAGTAVGIGGDPQPHCFDAVLAIGIEEDHNRVPLGVIQGVHCFGRHVQEGVLVLMNRSTKETVSGTGSCTLWVQCLFLILKNSRLLFCTA